MTDAEIRTRISETLRQNLSAGSREAVNLFIELAIDRGRNCGDHFVTIQQLHSRGGTQEEIDAGINVLLIANPKNKEPPIVISLHGIFTTGKWQKDLAPILTRSHMVPEPFDYGFFLPSRFLMPWLRARKIEWFLRKYTEVRRLNPKANISICAHSFGTYIVGYAMLKYEQIKFDNIILCGSILPENFPWCELLNSGRVRRVLNEYGGKDSWARRARRAVSDAGPSGYSGFNIPQHQDFFQRRHDRYKHSDFFHALQFEQSWLPFLKGETPVSNSIAYNPPKNWSFVLTITLVLLAAAILCWIVRRVLHPIFQR